MMRFISNTLVPIISILIISSAEPLHDEDVIQSTANDVTISVAQESVLTVPVAPAPNVLDSVAMLLQHVCDLQTDLTTQPQWTPFNGVVIPPVPLPLYLKRYDRLITLYVMYLSEWFLS